MDESVHYGSDFNSLCHIKKEFEIHVIFQSVTLYIKMLLLNQVQYLQDP